MAARFAATAAGLLIVSASFAGGPPNGAPPPDGAAMLQRMHPGVRLHLDQGRVRTIYGAPMTWGGTPDGAASQFLRLHAGAFGAGAVTLQPTWNTEIQDGRFTAFAYRQYIDGIPVEFGNARVLVLNGAVPRVVYAAGTLAARPAAGWPAATISGAQAVQGVKAMENVAFAALPEFTTPTAAIWQGTWPTTEARRAWKFEGFAPGVGSTRAYTFFVDMATGGLLEARHEVHHTDVTGTVRGWGSPGVLPDIASNPPQPLAIPEIRMAIQGGSGAFSERDGDFTIPSAGTAPVTVTSNLSAGRWVDVNPTGATELSLNLPGVIPPGNITPHYNAPQPTPANSPDTAQVNVFIHTNLIHNYYKDRAPGFTPIDIVLAANTGVGGACNAFFTGFPVPSINFYNSGGGCNNSAYASIVAHEYGHFVVDRLNLQQEAFGEGFSDAGALLLYDHPIIGPGFYTSGGYLRDPASVNQQYPCSLTAIHTCGMVLGGTWWDLLQLMKVQYGSAPGLEHTRTLQVAWAMITTGGSGTNAAHPGTLTEVLTVDDDDGNLSNGTPNRASICNAFGQHGISCPPLTLVAFQYPSGLPATLTPNQNTTIRVDAVPVAATVTPNSGQVSYSVDNAPFQTVAMNAVGANQYEAVIPGAPCLSGVRFYFSVGTTSGPVVDPPGAPGHPFVATSAASSVGVFTDTFETHQGWSGVGPGDNAATGRWNRMDPQPTPAQPGDDVTPAPGVACWVTDGNAGGVIGEFDVDGGQTTLTSPLLNVAAGEPGARIGYWRWYSNTQGTAPNADTFAIAITNNGGASWSPVETVGPAGPEAGGGWHYHEFRVSDIVTPTNQVRVRFIASDLGAASIVEAAVDDFKVVSFECGAKCYPDCDGANGLTVADFGCFQTKFVAGEPYADCNGDSSMTVVDFGCFQTAFVAGCP